VGALLNACNEIKRPTLSSPLCTLGGSYVETFLALAAVTSDEANHLHSCPPAQKPALVMAAICNFISEQPSCCR
jgi:hypothetical protein